MALPLNFQWEEAPGSKTLSNPGNPRAADQFTDAPAKLTARQSAFYRNLVRLAEQTGGKDSSDFLPNPGGDRKAHGLRVYEDRGTCRIHRAARKFGQRHCRDNNVALESVNLIRRRSRSRQLSQYGRRGCPREMLSSADSAGGVRGTDKEDRIVA